LSFITPMKDISLPGRLSFVLHHPDERHFADPGAPLLSFITSMKDISLPRRPLVFLCFNSYRRESSLFPKQFLCQFFLVNEVRAFFLRENEVFFFKLADRAADRFAGDADHVGEV